MGLGPLWGSARARARARERERRGIRVVVVTDGSDRARPYVRRRSLEWATWLTTQLGLLFSFLLALCFCGGGDGGCFSVSGMSRNRSTENCFELLAEESTETVFSTPRWSFPLELEPEGSGLFSKSDGARTPPPGPNRSKFPQQKSER